MTYIPLGKRRTAVERSSDRMRDAMVRCHRIRTNTTRLHEFHDSFSTADRYMLVRQIRDDAMYIHSLLDDALRDVSTLKPADSPATEDHRKGG